MKVSLGRAAPGLPTGRMSAVPAARILMIEDSDAIRLPVVTALTAHGFAVDSAPDGADLETRLPAFGPDLVIMDVMLPGRDGFTLLGLVRKASTAAVLMLTARDTLADRVQGLTAGADDYLVKPFAMAELVARVQAVLRRTRAGGSSISVGDLVINEDATSVARDGVAAGPDRHRAAAARLPGCAPGPGGQQDPDPDGDLGL